MRVGMELRTSNAALLLDLLLDLLLFMIVGMERLSELRMLGNPVCETVGSAAFRQLLIAMVSVLVGLKLLVYEALSY